MISNRVNAPTLATRCHLKRLPVNTQAEIFRQLAYPGIGYLVSDCKPTIFLQPVEGVVRQF